MNQTVQKYFTSYMEETCQIQPFSTPQIQNDSHGINTAQLTDLWITVPELNMLNKITCVMCKKSSLREESFSWVWENCLTCHLCFCKHCARTMTQ